MVLSRSRIFFKSVLTVSFSLVVFTQAPLLAEADQGTEQDVTDAEPIKRIPPRYPQECENLVKNENEEVVVEFDVTPSGETTNIQIISTTNDCFNDVAATAVESWRYAPKLLNGKPITREGIQTTFKFHMSEEKGNEVEPIKQVPAPYPDHCRKDARTVEMVALNFDVNPDGKPINIQVKASSNPCFNYIAKKTLEKWRYDIPLKDKGLGTPDQRKDFGMITNQNTRMTFKKEND